jgi:probable rRNA maturation factor
MLIHGMLHLNGFDHESESEALEMETLEARILEDLGFENPYQSEQQH